ncbi:MAG: phage major capsid protein [Endomicrobium sp.]|jgi:HK97 family phage major capsid protein|nr:phage major capsid protein [Endomicrobium sp.]
MLITREDIALLEKVILPGILSGVPKASVVLSMMTRLPNMTTGQEVMRVDDVLPQAYWVNGDTGTKQTTMAAWDKVLIKAEEVAVIVPISEAVLADADYDILGAIQPKIEEAFGRVIDEAIIFGKNKPAGFRNDIITSARNAGNNVQIPASNPNMYDLLLEKGGVISKVEEAGYMPNGVVAGLTMRANLRGIKDSNGQPIFNKNGMQERTQYALDGLPMFFPENGGFDSSITPLIVGDWKQAVYSIRQDITIKLLTEGVITDPNDSNKILYNLAQQDMVALRVVLRMGWALPNPATALDPDRTNFPFAYLEAKSGQSYDTRTVTFTVKDDASTPAAIKGARVTLNGTALLTDEDGKVVFNMPAGTYPYRVTKQGKVTQTADITVGSSAVTKTITLAKRA